MITEFMTAKFWIEKSWAGELLTGQFILQLAAIISAQGSWKEMSERVRPAWY